MVPPKTRPILPVEKNITAKILSNDELKSAQAQMTILQLNIESMQMHYSNLKKQVVASMNKANTTVFQKENEDG